MAKNQPMFDNIVHLVSTDTSDASQLVTDGGNLSLNHEQLNDDDIVALAEALTQNTDIKGLWLEHNVFGDKGALALAKMLETNTTLTKLCLGNNAFGDVGTAALEEAVLGNKNMIVTVLTPAAEAHCKANWKKILDLAALIEHVIDLRDMPSIWYDVAERLSTLELFVVDQRRVITEFKAFLETLPTIAIDQPFTLSDLLHAQCDYAPIDNPRTWEQWDEVVAALNEQGIYLRSAELLEGKKPNALLQRAIDYGKVKELFTPTNWQNASANELSAVLRALPPEAKETIPNLATLAARTSRSTAGSSEIG